MARVERREGARRTSAGGLASCRSGRLACSPTDRPTDRPTDLLAAYSVPPRRLARFAGRFVSFAAKDPDSPHAGDFSATKVPDCLFVRGECVRGSMCRWCGIIHAIVQSSSEICARNISRSKFLRRGRQSMRWNATLARGGSIEEGISVAMLYASVASCKRNTCIQAVIDEGIQKSLNELMFAL